jgi:signal transduction histidine kinase
MPLLLLTILPQLLGLPPVNAQITTLTVVLVPLAFGYSIVRYQLLVLDTYVRRIVTWLIGVVFLTILVYVAIILGAISNGTGVVGYTLIVSLIAVSAPLLWKLAHLVTDNILFRETMRQRRLLNKPLKLADEILNIDHIAQLVTIATLNAIETTQVCLFVLSEESGCYHLSPPLTSDQQDAGRHELMKRLLGSSRLLTPIASLPNAITLLPTVEERLQVARRPLFSYELTRKPGETPTGLERYFTSDSPDERGDLLFTPVRAQGKMIGVLALGERGDQQSYAGPDFEIIDLVAGRFTPHLETARLQERSRRYTRMLNDLYQVNSLIAGEPQTLESIASAYASVVARCLQVGVELWTYQEHVLDEPVKQPRELRRLVSLGIGPRLVCAETLSPYEEDWVSYFYDGKDEDTLSTSLLKHIPLCLTPVPSSPFTWLPLKKKSGEHLGILILSYGRPHQFLKDEVRLLEMFADQYGASLENAGIAIELRAAYERQKELDALKDQFIMTASHELRTPLTAVLGYLELLAQYRGMLDEETRDKFVASAHRGCDELMLMVNNIMDANQMQLTIDKSKLEVIPLREAVSYIVEMLEMVARREKRRVTIAIPSDLLVKADVMRLHQVLLNVLNNAFKYSDRKTPIEIDAIVEHGMVQTRIRDYGAGIPLEEQSRLFERFTRLERDLNSPVRGTGLGLYICKRLVKAMNGDIWVESEGKEGEGSTFIFSLPQAVIVENTTTEDTQPSSLPL